MPAPKKAQAARAEAAGGTVKFESQGLELDIPAAMPFTIMRYIQNGDLAVTAVVPMLREILGDEQLEKVWAAGLTMEQGLSLAADLFNAAGTSLGESSASQDSSTSDGT